VSEEFVVEGLGGGHALAQFQCDADDLAVWLKASAHQAASNNVARTFVMHPGDHRVIGYCSLTMHSIARAELGRSARGEPSTVPAVLLGKLALDRRATGQGLGSALLHDAMRRVVEANLIAAARSVLVDALHDEAASFYERFGFVRLASGDLRLHRKMSDIQRSVSS
jgi:GNAT superfamily N-acetyltransferase